MKAVIYARYSSDNQREESIEGQLRNAMNLHSARDIPSSKSMQTGQYKVKKRITVLNLCK